MDLDENMKKKKVHFTLYSVRKSIPILDEFSTGKWALGHYPTYYASASRVNPSGLAPLSLLCPSSLTSSTC